MMIPQGLCEGISCTENSPEGAWGFESRLPGKRCAAICLTERDSGLTLRFLAAESVSGVPESRADRYSWEGRCLAADVMAEEWFT